MGHKNAHLTRLCNVMLRNLRQTCGLKRSKSAFILQIWNAFELFLLISIVCRA